MHNRLGQFRINPGLMPGGMPVVGKGVPSRLAVFDQGSVAGTLSIAILLLETDSVIVVLSSSLALNDVPDWVGQLILEEILGVPNFEIKAAHTSVTVNLKWFPSLFHELTKFHTDGIQTRALEGHITLPVLLSMYSFLRYI